MSNQRGSMSTGDGPLDTAMNEALASAIASSADSLFASIAAANGETAREVH